MFIAFVRVEGLEPPSLAALDPKSSVSTNFTTPATQKRSAKVRILLHIQSLFESFFEIFFLFPRRCHLDISITREADLNGT